MELARATGLAAFGLGLIIVGAPIVAAGGEPLVVTTLPDPDPNFVPPSPEPKHSRRPVQVADASSTIDDAMREFGQAIGQASLAQQQAIEERCRANESNQGRPSDEARMAWEAACNYLRR
jgi:hypothetical protein